jgi:hypothetical protein
MLIFIDSALQILILDNFFYFFLSMQPLPPTPWLDASTTPIKSGQPATSSRQRVGQLVDSRRIVWQFDIARCREFL